MDLCESYFYIGNTVVECGDVARKQWDGQLLCDFHCSEAYNEAAWEKRWDLHQPTEEMVSNV